MGNVGVIFVSFLFWDILGIVLTVYSYTYVELQAFCISEWLATFNIGISFYFIVSFEKVVKTVTQKLHKLQQH